MVAVVCPIVALCMFKLSEAMPRKKRPTPPPPGSIPPKNIAAKPDPNHVQSAAFVSGEKATGPPSSSSRQSTAGSDIESNQCGVPQCAIPNCKLATHLSYGRQRHLALTQSRNRIGTAQSLPGDLTEAASSLTIQSNVEGELKLPIEDSAQQDLRKLLIQFFSSHFERIMLIYRPQRKDPAFKQVSYRLALHNPVYCLTLVAQAHMANIKDCDTPSDPATDRLTDLIYTQLLKLTREKVESFELDDVDVLLLAIVVLCEYDLKLDRYDALRSHHIGMSALVAKRGGIHNLGLSLPYVLRMDRFLAVRANQVPQFASSELPTSSVVLQHSADDLVYGSAFLKRTSNLSDQVLSLCSDSAQLLDLMHELDVTFEPNKLPETLNPKLEYFYFLRENLDTRHAILNHQRSLIASSINKDLLVLTAAKIVTYYIASANYLPIVTDLLATRLWNLLIKAPSADMPPTSATPPLGQSSNDSSYVPTIDLVDWSADMPMLLWLLFACALPSFRERCVSFAGHLKSVSTSPDLSRSSSGLSRASHSPTDSGLASRRRKEIVSPSSPRRHRYLPRFILHVAEHLVGERPIAGTTDWDDEIIYILESFAWAGDRLSTEFQTIIGRVHEHVLARAEEEA